MKRVLIVVVTLAILAVAAAKAKALVVIAIIAILIGLLLPAIDRSEDQHPAAAPAHARTVFNGADPVHAAFKDQVPITLAVRDGGSTSTSAHYRIDGGPWVATAPTRVGGQPPREGVRYYRLTVPAGAFRKAQRQLDVRLVNTHGEMTASIDVLPAKVSPAPAGAPARSLPVPAR
jgi:hypothetical protein